MPISKEVKQAEKRRVRNQAVRTSLRNYVRKAQRLVDSNELSQAEEAVQVAMVALDKAASKGVIYKNNAARRKSRLMAHLNKAKEAASAG